MASQLIRAESAPGKTGWSGRKLVSVVFGSLVSVCFVGLLLKRVNLHDSWQTLREVEPRFLLFPALMCALNYPLRALRWQLIFPHSARPGFWPAFRAYAIGTAANNFAPARAGDLARCILISQNSTLEGSSLALATFAIEKVLDGLTLFGIVLWACLFTAPPAWLSTLAITALFLFGGAMVVICLLRSRAEWFLARLQAFLGTIRLGFLTGKVTGLFSSFREGLSGIASGGQISALIVTTALIWITDAGSIWGMAKALGLTISMPYSLLATAVIGLGLAVPAAPGSIGTYEFFAVSALSLAGIPSAGALALALLLHSWVFVTTSIVGLAGFAWTGLTFKQFAHEEEIWRTASAATVPEER